MKCMSPTATADWERHRIFGTVLREGSLSAAAARALRVVQPNVQRRIRELERQVGAALVTRSPSGLTPTAHGLADPADAVAVAADHFARAASAEAGAATSVVRHHRFGCRRRGGAAARAGSAAG